MLYSIKKYCFVKWRQTLDSLVPDLPEEVSRELLAEPPGNAGYALYLLGWPEELPWSPEAEVVPPYLSDLLDSARQYPPALAIARDIRFQREQKPQIEFVETFADSLRTYLEEQRTSRFFLAQAIREDAGYKNAGSYYWIVGYRPDRLGREVSWVSADFFVYQAPVTDFDIDASWLAERFHV